MFHEEEEITLSAYTQVDDLSMTFLMYQLVHARVITFSYPQQAEEYYCFST